MTASISVLRLRAGDGAIGTGHWHFARTFDAELREGAWRSDDQKDALGHFGLAEN